MEHSTVRVLRLNHDIVASVFVILNTRRPFMCHELVSVSEASSLSSDSVGFRLIGERGGKKVRKRVC